MLRKRKQVYYYDTENCEYRRAEFNAVTFSKKLGSFLAVGFVFVLIARFSFPSFIADFKTQHLEEVNKRLENQMNSLDEKLDAQERGLKQLLARDNGIYLPIVGEKLISRSEWEGGRGGAPVALPLESTPSSRMSQRLDKMTFQIGLLRRSLASVSSKMGAKEIELRTLPSIAPVNGNLISGFGNRTHPVTGHTKFHEGLDFACQTGTPIYASGDAVVESADYNENGYGNCINLNHQNGYRTKYAHLSSMLVSEGQKVSRGDLIGYSGSTGLSSGPHLHYEVSFREVKIDPIDFFYQNLSPEKYRDLASGEAAEEFTKEELKARLNDAEPLD